MCKSLAWHVKDQNSIQFGSQNVDSVIVGIEVSFKSIKMDWASTRCQALLDDRGTVIKGTWRDMEPLLRGLLFYRIRQIFSWVIKQMARASLVAQWLRICLPMQGTWVRALVWEDPTCHGATGPVSHNYWACASGACAPQQERPW